MSSNIKIQKTCQFCGKKFIARKTVTQYCSHTCSQRGYKERKRNERIERAREKDPSCTQPFFSQPPIINNREQINNREPTLEKEFLTVGLAAGLMGVSHTTMYRYCVTGKIPCVKFNRKIFIRRKDIDARFEEAGLYEVTPIERKPITAFYTMEEIIEKYNYSEATVYNTVNAKRIPKTVFQGRALFSKKHIDKHFVSKVPDPEITEWYSRDEIESKYALPRASVYTLVSANIIPRKNEKGRTFYSKQHVDALLHHRLPDPAIKEWYSMDEIVERYGLEPTRVANLVCRNAIPKNRRGNKGYYSKIHFDAMMEKKFPPPTYYSVEEDMSVFSLSRDAIYQFVKRHDIPIKKEGRYIKISKTHLDELLDNRKNQTKPWEQK